MKKKQKRIKRRNLKRKKICFRIIIMYKSLGHILLAIIKDTSINLLEMEFFLSE